MHTFKMYKLTFWDVSWGDCQNIVYLMCLLHEVVFLIYVFVVRILCCICKFPIFLGGHLAQQLWQCCRHLRTACFGVLDSTSVSSFLLKRRLGSGRWFPGRRFLPCRWENWIYFRLQATAWSRLSCCRHLGSKVTNGRSFFFCLSD